MNGEKGDVGKMKVVLLGEQRDSEFVSALRENNTLEWADNPQAVDKECAYVIILTQDIAKSAETRETLLAIGLDDGKILEYCYFEKEPSRSRAEFFQQKYNQNNYDSFLFGMSHSHSGLNEDMLKGKNIYKFSAPSMDLYYHYQLLIKLEEIYDLSKLKRIYFELPYYVFNYDVSKCPNVFGQRINFFYYLQDYHHFGESQFGERYIYMFEMMNNLTGNRFYNKFQNVEINTKSTPASNYFEKIKRTMYYAVSKKEKHQWGREEIKEVENLRPHVWYKKHTDTIDENIEIWNLIQEWQKEHNWIDITVIVFPFCPYFINSHRKAIEARKVEFMQNINLPDNEILDMFDCYINRPEYFADECHLNERGTYNFSKLLGKNLK